MAKKAHKFDEAEKLYVVELLSLKTISDALSVSERTLIDWKKEGKWGEKREAFLKDKQSFHKEMYEFSRALMQSVKEDLEEKRPVEQAKYFALGKFAIMFGKVKEYEDSVADGAKTTPTGSKEDIIAAIEAALGA